MGLSQRKSFVLVLVLLKFVCEVFCCDLPSKSERFECGNNIQTRQKCLDRNCCYNNFSAKCYFPTKDAAGGLIEHPNGLCIYPKGGSTAPGTKLMWSPNCYSRNAVFLVSNDYPTYHIASGLCILPHGRVGDPGDNSLLVLGETGCKRRAWKFRPAANGNLKYFYLNDEYHICIGSGYTSAEPQGGEYVKLSKEACRRTTKSSHLTYVCQKQFSPKVNGSIGCPANSLIRVTWANYGVLSQEIPVIFKSTRKECTTNTSTSIMQQKCNGKKDCVFMVSEKDFLATTCEIKRKYLVVRYTCDLDEPVPGKPKNIKTSPSFTSIKVSWDEPTDTNGIIINYRVCSNNVQSLLRHCQNVASDKRSTTITNLKPGVPYEVIVQAFTRVGGGELSKKPAITKQSVILTRSDKAVSHKCFEILFGKLKVKDKYIQIIVQKLVNDKPPKRVPKSYLQSDLKAYNKHSLPTTPYITAELSRYDVIRNPKFTVGDGKRYSKSNSRKRRNIGFLNVEVEPGSYYSVFQRTFQDDDMYYNSKWMDVVRTKVFANQTLEDNSPTRIIDYSRGNPPNSSMQTIGFIVVIVVQFIVNVILGVLVIRLFRERRSKGSRTKRMDEQQQKVEFYGDIALEMRNSSHEYETPTEANHYQELDLNSLKDKDENVYQSLKTTKKDS